MKICRMAGAQCPHEATSTVRIDGVGDRDLCADHTKVIVDELHMGRVLDANSFVPEWRQRLSTKDMTASVLA